LGEAVEIETLTAGKNGGQHLMRFSSGKDKDNMGGRFLQGLKQSIRGWLGEHMNLIYDIDFIFGNIGDEVSPLSDPPNLINTSVTRGVNLYYIQSSTLSDSLAYFTGITRLPPTVIKAIHRFSQDASGASFPCATGAAEEVGVSYPPALQSIEEGLSNRLLPHYFS
jgi:hypothetical protein